MKRRGKKTCAAEVTESGGRKLPDLRRQFGEVVCVSIKLTVISTAVDKPTRRGKDYAFISPCSRACFPLAPWSIYTG